MEEYFECESRRTPSFSVPKSQWNSQIPPALKAARQAGRPSKKENGRPELYRFMVADSEAPYWEREQILTDPIWPASEATSIYDLLRDEKHADLKSAYDRAVVRARGAEETATDGVGTCSASSKVSRQIWRF